LFGGAIFRTRTTPKTVNPSEDCHITPVETDVINQSAIVGAAILHAHMYTMNANRLKNDVT
jgi:hypothetical protein